MAKKINKWVWVIGLMILLIFFMNQKKTGFFDFIDPGTALASVAILHYTVIGIGIYLLIKLLFK